MKAAEPDVGSTLYPIPPVQVNSFLQAGPTTVIEVGCGAGNSVFPLLTANKNPLLRVFACDYAPQAIHLVKVRPVVLCFHSVLIEDLK